MAILRACNLGMGFGEHTLFENGNFEIEEKEAVGLIGANGAGKTTLFKMITGELESAQGEIITAKNTVVGYMEQHACEGSVLTLYEELMTVFADLRAMEVEMEKLNTAIDNQEGDLDESIKRQGLLNEKYQADGGLTYKSRVRAVLIGLGFSEDDFSLPVRNLSGGQKSKLSLGKLLLSGANLLLLDEPTNHLDIESVEWLESFLKDYKGASLIISHDRYFLDKVTTKTVEIEAQNLVMRKGGYSVFMKLKAEKKLAKQRNYDNTMAEVHRIEGIIAQQRQWNRERNIKTAESKQKVIDKLLEGLEKPEEEAADIHFEFTFDRVTGNDVLTCQRLAKRFDGKSLFKNLDLYVTRKERVFLLGPNGCGKTTLLRILTGEQNQDAGTFMFGANVKIGYFDQNVAHLDSSKSVLDEIWDEHKDFTETKVRSALAVFLFRGDDVYKRVCDLSGGEKAKIALLKLMLTGANVLLLDEPTNHLDIRSREALESALSAYEGTLLVVSHDRYFINKLATKIIRFLPDGAKVYDGDYDSYAACIANRTETAVQQEKPKVNAYKQKKERESILRKLRTRISACEADIAHTEEEMDRTNTELTKPEISSDYEKVLEKTTLMEQLKEKQEQLYAEWTELQENLEAY